MLVIRVLWLQAALASAQLLDGVLGGGESAGSSSVEDPGASETTPAQGIVGGLAGNGTPPEGGLIDPILDPILDPVVGSTGLLPLSNDGAVAATTLAESAEPVATTFPEPTPNPRPTEVKPAEETPVPEPTAEPTSEPAPEATPQPSPEETPKQTSEPTPEPTPKPAPATEQTAPTPLPTAGQQPPAGEQQQQPAPAPLPAAGQQPPAGEQQQPPAPAPVSTEETSAAAAPTPTAATSTPATLAPPAGNTDALPVSSPTRAPAPASSNAVQTSAAAAGPDRTSPSPSAVNSSPASSAPQQEITQSPSPVLTLVTASGSTFMSVFLPARPTGVLGAVDGESNLGSSTGGSPNDSTDRGSGNGNTNPDPFNPVYDTFTDPGATTDDASSASGTSSAGGNTSNAGTTEPSVSSSGMPLPTKIGIGVGVGAGSVLCVVCVTWLLWRRRMRRGSSWRRGTDAENGGGRGSPTPQEKAKLDWESGHDVAFDFGAFLGARQTTGREQQEQQGYREGRGDRLPAFETMPVRQGRMQGVAPELDGGVAPVYRGVVGLAR